MKLLASLALGIALGVIAALYLVFWRSGAEPETDARRLAIARRQLGYLMEPDEPDDYDGEPVGV